MHFGAEEGGLTECRKLSQIFFKMYQAIYVEISSFLKPAKLGVFFCFFFWAFRIQAFQLLSTSRNIFWKKNYSDSHKITSFQGSDPKCYETPDKARNGNLVNSKAHTSLLLRCYRDLDRLYLAILSCPAKNVCKHIQGTRIHFSINFSMTSPINVVGWVFFPSVLVSFSFSN